MKSFRLFLLLFFSVMSATYTLDAKVPAFIKMFAKNYAKRAVRDFFFERGIASPLGIGLSSFDMELFDEVAYEEKVAMMRVFIGQLGITDAYIGWNLYLSTSTIKAIRAKCDGNLDVMAQALTNRVRWINFARKHWRKAAILAGVGAVAGLAWLVNHLKISVSFE